MSTVTVGANPTGRLADNTTAGRSITLAWPRTDPRFLPTVYPLVRDGVRYVVRVQSSVTGGTDFRPAGMVYAWVEQTQTVERERPLPAIGAQRLTEIADEVLAAL